MLLIFLVKPFTVNTHFCIDVIAEVKMKSEQ